MNFIKLKTGIVETNTYFVAGDDGRCIVIDPGDDTEKIFAALNENSFRCEFVLLTHAHFDHCNSAFALQRNGAKILMHKKDVTLVKTDDNLADKFGVFFNKFKPDELISDGDELNLCGFSVKVLHTPGHTAGSCCYIIENMIFTGDTMMYLSCGRTDFPTGNARDMVKSLKKLASIDKNYTVFPGHGITSKLDFEKNNNPYVQ